MNTGTPTPNEKDQVKLNQRTSGAEAPKDTSPPQTPAVPPSSSPPPPTVVPPPPIASSTPMPPSPPPTPPPPPTPTKEEQEIGVGKPNIGVELEAEKPAETPVAPPTPAKPVPIAPAESQTGKIEVQTSDIPIKTYDQSKTTEQPTPPPKGAPSGPKPAIPVSPVTSSTPTTPGVAPTNPPVKASTGSPAVMITVLAILALILGGAGGFFGFRTWDHLKTSASVEKSPEATLTATSSEEPSLDVSRWQSYTSTLYNFSLKYPNGWVASTIEPSAETIVFAANNDSLGADPSSFRIEINFQDANGKILKSWVEANSTATNEKTKAQEINIDGQTAYQQELTNTRPAVATYLERPDKIMIVTYTAPADQMSEGGDWYNNLINSIKLK